MREWLWAMALFWVGCTADPLGDPCLPEHVPPDGFHASETYVESGSTECVTGVCVVHGLDGDPSPSCTDACESEATIAEHVYCSCRCDEQGPAPPCACSAGFHCESAGSVGSYCVRD